MSVYFYGCVTLDGYLAGKNHELDWLHQTGAAEDTGYEDFYAHMNVTLMGRRTFRELEKAGAPAEARTGPEGGPQCRPAHTRLSGKKRPPGREDRAETRKALRQ